MKKLLIAAMVFLSVGCATKPVVSSYECTSDCRTEIVNMKSYTSKFAGYTITSTDKDSFSATTSSADNYNYRSGSVSNGYVNVWVEDGQVNIEAVNNGTPDKDMTIALEGARTHDWPTEVVHPTERVVIDETRSYVQALFLNNRSR